MKRRINLSRPRRTIYHDDTFELRTFRRTYEGVSCGKPLRGKQIPIRSLFIRTQHIMRCQPESNIYVCLLYVTSFRFFLRAPSCNSLTDSKCSLPFCERKNATFVIQSRLLQTNLKRRFEFYIREIYGRFIRIYLNQLYFGRSFIFFFFLFFFF